MGKLDGRFVGGREADEDFDSGDGSSGRQRPTAGQQRAALAHGSALEARSAPRSA